MGVGLQQYRARIGSFSHAQHHKRGPNKPKYTPYTHGSDVHFRSVLCGLLLTFVFMSAYCVIRSHHILVEHYADTRPLTIICNINQPSPSSVTSIDLLSELNSVHFLSSAQNRLMLSGDVELNPGPTSDTTMILEAIKDSNTKMSAELDVLKNEIKHIRGDLSSVKFELGSIKEQVRDISQKQSIVEHQVESLNQKASQLEHDRDVLQSDMEHLGITADRGTDRLDIIEQQLNIMESDKLKCSMRIFGLPESESDTKSLHSVLDDNVFSVTDPAENLTSACLSNAKRVGVATRANTSKPRMVIVNFTHHADKVKLFPYRDTLRKSNIRIANDLSYTQRQQVKEASDRGFIGFYKNGKFCTVPKQSRRTVGGGDRVYRRGVRTLDDRNRQYLAQSRLDSGPTCEIPPDNAALVDIQPVD